MIEFLSNLFQKDKQSDNYTQAEREALLEIILLSTYADSHIDLSEKKIMDLKRDLKRPLKNHAFTSSRHVRK